MKVSFARRSMIGLIALQAIVPVQQAPAAAPRSASQPGQTVLETTPLRSIAAWLKSSGREGYIAADVADAMGIAREADQDLLQAKQRGFRNDEVLRIAQVSADEAREFLLFMVQRPDGQLFFYLSTVREGLRKAFVSIPSRNLVAPLEPAEAEASFREEVLYWEDKVAMR